MSSVLSPKAVGISLAGTLVIVFVLCAVAQMVISTQFSHAWIGLFTTAPQGSLTAWIEGVLFSAIVGFITGYVFAWVYNKVLARGM